MTKTESSAVIQDVHALLESGAAGNASDARLLERFLVHYGEPEAELAFSVLVARHGPMVLGVCRRALSDPNDVADAFQATFLVLVRKAGSVRVDDSLGRWLYGVSRRVAAKARAANARRTAREEGALGTEPVDTARLPDAARRELLEAIDEEIERLPGPFRAAVVLCDLEGLTHETAAGQLGCPVGTIESRLSRGRRRLRERLTRRGLAPMISGFEGLLLRGVPESLSRSTVEVAMRIATVSTATSALIEATMKDMAMKKAITMVLGLGAITMVCGLGITSAPRVMAENEQPKSVDHPTAVKDEPSAWKAQGLQPPARIKPGDRLLIEVLEALPGRPIDGERLVRPDGTISLGFYGDLEVAGLTRMEIKAKLIEHLRQYLTDDCLGLVEYREGDPNNPNDGTQVSVDPKKSNRVFVDDSLNYSSPRPGLSLTPREGPSKVKPGDQMLIEVLNALPGRPISGVRMVRPDGTISLGFYGDLNVAGLTRRELKEKVVAHLSRFLPKENLGLSRNDPRTGKRFVVEPADSDQIFVDESINLWGSERSRDSEAKAEKLNQILQSIEELKQPGPRSRRSDPAMAQRLTDHDRRLEEIEAKLDRLIQAIEGLK